MYASSYKRSVGLLAAGLALSATGLAAAARPVGTPAGTAGTGATPALKEPRTDFVPRTVGQAVAGTPPPPATAFPVAGPAGFGETAARYGSGRGGRSHEGQDVFAPAGTPLVAVRDGVVLETGDDGGRGNYVAIYAPAARQTYVYLHMNEPARVKPGDRVKAGRRIGAVGCTGSCFGDHLHFEVRRGRGTQAASIDPLPLLLRWRRAR